LRGADAAEHSVAEALQEGQEVLDEVMGGESAHLKRDADEQESSDIQLSLSLNENARITRLKGKHTKRGRKQSRDR
jgi:hypothetical protein